MSWTFVACVGIAFAWMGLFYLCGKGFLTVIKAEKDVASCIPFGYLVLQVIYQIIYLPFYFIKGSYRATVYIWIGIVMVGSVLLVLNLKRNSVEHKKKLEAKEKLGICIAAIVVFGLAVYISLHVPFYGQDTVTYISAMNESFYRDVMWISTKSEFHYGMCSMFQFFTISSVLTGIRPYYISLFTVRIVGIGLFSMICYRMGSIVFSKTDKFCWPAILLSVLVTFLLMLWGSMYTAEFFYWRINEAKGFCQFVLLPLGFSVFLNMFKSNVERKDLWLEQLLVGIGAVAVSASSLTPYLFLLLMGTFALLAYDKLKDGWKTIGHSVICAVPNLLYLIVYVFERNGMIVM